MLLRCGDALVFGGPVGEKVVHGVAEVLLFEQGRVEGPEVSKLQGNVVVAGGRGRGVAEAAEEYLDSSEDVLPPDCRLNVTFRSHRTG